MDYNDMLAVSMPQQQQIPTVQASPAVENAPLDAGFATMMQPQPDFTAANRPAANAQELDRRMTGWAALANKIQTDPNLRQAMLVTGASMMQPLQPGQTGMGSLGQSMVAGAGAYAQGEQRAFQQKVIAGREKREEDRAGMEKELHPERVRQARAGSRRAETEADVAVATRDDAIRRTRAATEAAELANATAYNEEQVRQLERDIRAVRAFRQRSTVDRELDMELEKAETALAQAKLNKEKTGYDVSLSRLTTDTLSRMDSKELERIVKAKFTGQAGQGSAIVQQMDAWGQLYDKLPPTDPNRQGRTKEQYVAEQLKSAKVEDITKMRKAYVDSGGDDTGILAEFDQLLRTNLSRRGGSGDSATPAPQAAGKKTPVRITTRQEYDALQKGDQYIDPKGVLRTKQ